MNWGPQSRHDSLKCPFSMYISDGLRQKERVDPLIRAGAAPPEMSGPLLGRRIRVIVHRTESPFEAEGFSGSASEHDEALSDITACGVIISEESRTDEQTQKTETTHGVRSRASD